MRGYRKFAEIVLPSRREVGVSLWEFWPGFSGDTDFPRCRERRCTRYENTFGPWTGNDDDEVVDMTIGDIFSPVASPRCSLSIGTYVYEQIPTNSCISLHSRVHAFF